MNYLRLALEESIFSIGTSRPNPAVGAVVVKDGIIVGKGRTQRPGSAHAEVMALRDAGELARGAAIYVTLEPCCHYGRTPPCTKAIIDAGIVKVFYAHGDPNPVVRGNSRKVLEEAGIEVLEGEAACIAAEVMEEWTESEDECHCLMDGLSPADKQAHLAEGRYVFHDIERFFEGYDYFVCNKRTFVEVKSAVSVEGFMGLVSSEGEHLPVRITGEDANCWNHELRAISDCILVAAGTLLSDNPYLNVRLVPGNDPVKIIWAGHHEFTAEEVQRLNVFANRHFKERFDEGSCDILVFSCVPQPALAGCCSHECVKWAEISCEIILLTALSFEENWTSMVDELSARGMHRLMVEPGCGLAQQLFASVSFPNSKSTSFQGSFVGRPLWNRLDYWRSTDSRVDDAIANLVSAGGIKDGLEFPALPENLVAKESFMAGSDVLTVYYPA